jgi:ribosomal protein S18 acetylase RimI-like enzyme
MTQDEYDDWRGVSLAAYVAEMVESGALPLEAARARAEEQQLQLLPRGLGTPRTHLLRVLDASGEPAGVLWIGPSPQRPDAGFVYEVSIDEDRRGQGLGRGAMVAAERIAREEGWTELGLHVFGSNERARLLYESLGYQVVSITMAKTLTG